MSAKDGRSVKGREYALGSSERKLPDMNGSLKLMPSLLSSKAESARIYASESRNNDRSIKDSRESRSGLSGKHTISGSEEPKNGRIGPAPQRELIIDEADQAVLDLREEDQVERKKSIVTFVAILSGLVGVILLMYSLNISVLFSAESDNEPVFGLSLVFFVPMLVCIRVVFLPGGEERKRRQQIKKLRKFRRMYDLKRKAVYHDWELGEREDIEKMEARFRSQLDARINGIEDSSRAGDGEDDVGGGAIGFGGPPARISILGLGSGGGSRKVSMGSFGTVGGRTDSFNSSGLVAGSVTPLGSIAAVSGSSRNAGGSFGKKAVIPHSPARTSLRVGDSGRGGVEGGSGAAGTARTSVRFADQR